MDPVAQLLRVKTVRRTITLATFAALVVLFRRLIPLMVFFLIFERGLGYSSSWISRRIRVPRKVALLTLVALLLGVVGSAIALGIERAVPWLGSIRHTLPDRIAAFGNDPLYLKLRSHLQDTDRYLELLKHYAASAVGYVTALGHLFVHATIGLILAVIYLFDEEEISNWACSIPPRTYGGTMVRWFGHLADAVSLTIQLQLIVAGCNAILTLPILFVLGLPYPGALVLLIFLGSLVPVVGNLVSGAVLSFLAFQTRGWPGIAVFTVVTAILHKLESYYLNPRLTSRHVRLPGFVLILSLVAWEHLLGLVGLFVSFPFLFVALRIRAELTEEDAGENATHSAS